MLRTSASSDSKMGKVLNLDTINSRVRDMEYAVRGALPTRAEQLAQTLSCDSTKASLPFKQIIFCNLGNPQQLEQKPLTFLRQVSSLVEYPELLSPEKIEQTKLLFPGDAISRARSLLASVGPSIGAYTGSSGLLKVRQDVAKFIEHRDGFPSDPSNIQLTNGASEAVARILELVVSDPSVGIMIPIPQYPLYTATLTRLGAQAVPYYLQEESKWSMDVPGLTGILRAHREKGINVRAIVIINPGNPTGGVLSSKNMSEIVQFCEREKLVILADEVYQANTYDKKNTPFTSFKKVVSQLSSDVELFSFHSISKGMVGECGRRGGYLEMHNISDSVKDVLNKMASVSLCSNVPGQLAVDIMVNPPQPGDESHDQYNAELDSIYNSLKSRANKLYHAFNSLENVSCQPAQGAMYLFPQIKLPNKFIDYCSKDNKLPDQEYCMRMLESTGVCVVPGSGFGQVQGTFHFRTTFLPQEKYFDSFIHLLTVFHKDFMNQFR
ncbi:hypothetical protein BB560_005481 [Smittium megazygosporum]|uniref:Glutamate pyruvate transaminase n=1 Tax=Smittium megazygosporum TaxID=133381 RepID=A0A2T9Z4L9_9FUNG|nr:hypothetical protein BB560_005481 [Smittium megazygosporum]